MRGPWCLTAALFTDRNDSEHARCAILQGAMLHMALSKSNKNVSLDNCIGVQIIERSRTRQDVSRVVQSVAAGEEKTRT